MLKGEDRAEFVELGNNERQPLSQTAIISRDNPLSRPVPTRSMRHGYSNTSHPSSSENNQSAVLVLQSVGAEVELKRLKATVIAPLNIFSNQYFNECHMHIVSNWVSNLKDS